MSSWDRFINILKQKRMSDVDSDLSPAEIERLLQDDDSAELSRAIEELNSAVHLDAITPPPDIAAAFMVLQIRPTTDTLRIKTAFKKQIRWHHPDKYPNANSQKLQELQAKTADIIKANKAIKKWLDNEKK